MRLFTLRLLRLLVLMVGLAIVAGHQRADAQSGCVGYGWWEDCTYCPVSWEMACFTFCFYCPDTGALECGYSGHVCHYCDPYPPGQICCPGSPWPECGY